MALNLDRSSNSGHGFGKTILFGEHFVVHGLPAFVAALPLVTIATVHKLDHSEYRLVDNRPKNSGFQATKTDKYYNLLHNILSCMGITSGVEVTLAGDLLVTSGGIGASAATAGALARALNNEFGLQWDDEKINEAALQGEKAVHGNPSGIDNAAAVFGGTFIFQKHKNSQHKRTVFTLNQPLDIVLADSGVVSDTKSVIADFNTLKEKKPHVVDEVFQSYEELFKKAQHALGVGDLQAVGLLMSNNHALLKKMQISNPELDEMVELACQAGALGAKLTGTGRGGVVVALTPGKLLQAYVAKIFRQCGYVTIQTSIQ